VIDDSTDVSGIPYGNWVITSSQPTMGPICIFIEKNDTVSFINDFEDSGKFIFRFKSLAVEYFDIYSFELVNNKYLCEGLYNVKLFDKNLNIIDTLLPQKMMIQYLNSKEINCIITHSYIDYQINELTFGDVSNFTAKKIE
jgi:hypothetical protein